MAEKVNVPAIRFKGFTEAWEQRKLNEISEIIGGGTPSTNNPDYWDGDIDWYAPAEMEGQIYATGSIRKITEIGLQNSSAKVLPAHRTVLFTSRAGIGKMAILQRPGATNQGFQSMVLKDEYNPYFVYSMGSVIKEKAEGIASGSTFLEISGKMLGNLEIMVPNKTEQDAIAKYFESVDNLITLHQRKLLKLKNIKIAMLEKMLPKNGMDVPEIRFSGFAEAWEQRKLGENASFLKGQGYSKKDLVENGFPIILYGRLYTSYETTIRAVDTFVKCNSDSIISKGNEVIVPASGETAEDIARASAVANSGIILGGDLNIIYPEENIDSTFLALSISNGNAQKELSTKAQGKSVVHLRNPDLKNLELYFPYIDEQRKISLYFEKIDNLITLHQRKLEKLKNLKKACLDKMFV